MPSEAAKRRAAQKKAQKQASSRSTQKKPVSATPVTDEEEVKSKPVSGGASPVIAGGNSLRSGLAEMKISHRSCTGKSINQ